MAWPDLYFTKHTEAAVEAAGGLLLSHPENRLVAQTKHRSDKSGESVRFLAC